jgi:DNA-binding beta-propeller fold protein YncE
MTSHLGKDFAMTAVSLPVGRLSRRAKAALAVGALVVVAIAAAVSFIAVVSHRPSQKHTVSYSSQVVLPFTHLDEPWGVAVDRAGNLFITDHTTHQLLKLAAGASAPTPLPSAGLTDPTGVAVDNAGNVYVTDNGNDQVWKLAPGADNPPPLPFSGLKDPDGVWLSTPRAMYTSPTTAATAF